MTRIRYKKYIGTGNLHSKPILAGTRMVVVSIMPALNQFVITDYETSAILQQGTAASLSKLKSVAKAMLKELGAPFEAEVRRHDPLIENSILTRS